MKQGKMLLFTDHDELELGDVFSILYHVAGLTGKPEHREALDWLSDFQQRMRRGTLTLLPDDKS